MMDNLCSCVPLAILSIMMMLDEEHVQDFFYEVCVDNDHHQEHQEL